MTLSVPLVEPAYFHRPPYRETFGPEVSDLAAMAGFAPDPEQALALDAMFAIDATGKAASFEFAIICPRQNMKTGLLKMAALGWLFVTDQQLIVWSAHEMRTTREAFRDLTNLIVNCEPLRKRLAPGPSNGIMSGNGNEMIELAPTKACPDGQRILFKARTNGGGRGLTGDKVILDEAFALKPSHMGSLLPTLSARPDPQVVYGSSAGLSDSDVLRSIRDRGRPGTDPSLAYMEFCAPKDICASPDCPHTIDSAGCGFDNPAYVQMANPAAGRRISLDHIRAERRALPPAEFGRERLGWWDEPAIEDGPLISREMWARLSDAHSTPINGVAFGVYVNKLQTSAAIGVAGYREDGKIHVGIVPARRGGNTATLPGIDWIPARMKELRDTWKPVAWGLDDRSAAGTVLPELQRLGFDVGTAIDNVTASDVARACMGLYARINEDGIRHRGAKPLADAVTAGRARDLADGWAWDRKDATSDIVQLMAITLAVHGLLTAPPPTQVWSFYS